MYNVNFSRQSSDNFGKKHCDSIYNFGIKWHTNIEDEIIYPKKNIFSMWNYAYVYSLHMMWLQRVSQIKRVIVGRWFLRDSWLHPIS